mmetsp:Transcript_39589/g.117789  ORF Transcript_39589/g.117789 Transcript_39589/m.117789 type:complete len:128 (-) Transcript_39589:828-1211(-)
MSFYAGTDPMAVALAHHPAVDRMEQSLDRTLEGFGLAPLPARTSRGPRPLFRTMSGGQCNLSVMEKKDGGLSGMGSGPAVLSIQDTPQPRRSNKGSRHSAALVSIGSPLPSAHHKLERVSSVDTSKP